MSRTRAVNRPRLLPFVAVEVSTVLSGTANGITSVVLPWLVLERTGSAAATGLVAALTAVPMLFASFFSGTIVDRVGRRRTAIVSDVLSAASVAALPVVDLALGLDLWWICVLAVLGAVFDPAGVTAREAMLPEAARAGGLRLERVNGIHEAAWGTAFIVGPGLAGVSIGLFGAVTTLWGTAIAFVLSAVVITAVRLPGAGRPVPSQHHEPTGFWQDTVVGLSFVRRDPVLLSVGLFSALLMATYMPIEAVLLPVHFTAENEPAHLGILVMTMSIGWVLGSLTYSAVGHRLPRRAVFVAAAIGTALALVPLAFLPPFPVMLVAGALSGFLYGPVGPLLNLAMQIRTPEHLRGRVTGLLTSFGTAAAPLGYLVAGPLVQGIGLQPTFFVMVALVLVAGVTTVFIRPLAALDAEAGDVLAAATKPAAADADETSGAKEHLSGGLAALQHPVSPGGLGERHLRADPDLEASGGDPAQHVRRPLP